MNAKIESKQSNKKRNYLWSSLPIGVGVILLLGWWINVACFSQSVQISLPLGTFQVDTTHRLILARFDSLSHYRDVSSAHQITVHLGKETGVFDHIPDSLEYGKGFVIDYHHKKYALHFTELPVLTIDAADSIPNEPKIVAQFSYTDREQTFNAQIGVELRGGGSIFYPKKTYDIEFWDDEEGNATHDRQFDGMRLDDDWVLDALYNEPLRIRSYMAQQLWLEITEPLLSSRRTSG